MLEEPIRLCRRFLRGDALSRIANDVIIPSDVVKSGRGAAPSVEEVSAEWSLRLGGVGHDCLVGSRLRLRGDVSLVKASDLIASKAVRSFALPVEEVPVVERVLCLCGVGSVFCLRRRLLLGDVSLDSWLEKANVVIASDVVERGSFVSPEEEVSMVESVFCLFGVGGMRTMIDAPPLSLCRRRLRGETSSLETSTVVLSASPVEGVRVVDRVFCLCSLEGASCLPFLLS